MVKYFYTAGFHIRYAGVLVPREYFVPRYELRGNPHKAVVGSHHTDKQVPVQELICTPSHTEAQKRVSSYRTDVQVRVHEPICSHDRTTT